jgi:iron complex outermembrane receptor protein
MLFPSRLTLLAACCSVSFLAQAAEPIELGMTDVTADAIKTNSNTLPAPYAGGQVARGGQMGVLGN